ncbi:diaminobutyrate acetyltransferase [Isoalcanivorax beigongshangi]|uniref:L-2,4-diaminobutyric acid acetyltransferase n=1 Tax=Isoalcanivorax beigongshangi TaxID=3238810 RepID=A0ABV4ADZ3_9GAMM
MHAQAATPVPVASPSAPIVLRSPESEDGQRVHALVRACRPLDENSIYCNILQCSHFAETCVAAERDGELVGFISGYIPPKQADTLFVWQVAVRDDQRGEGLAGRMLDDLLARAACAEIRYIETTITPDNDASWRMFRRFAARHAMPTEEFILFASHSHFSGLLKDEHLLRIGPFNQTQL